MKKPYVAGYTPSIKDMLRAGRDILFGFLSSMGSCETVGFIFCIVDCVDPLLYRKVQPNPEVQMLLGVNWHRHSLLSVVYSVHSVPLISECFRRSSWQFWRLPKTQEGVQ